MPAAISVHSKAAAVVMLLLSAALAGCEDDPRIADAAAPTATATASPTPTSVPRFDCEGFITPSRADTSACGDVNAEQPDQLVSCLRGSGHLGQWAIDAARLPAYDFTVEQRCDPAAHAYSPRTTPLRDPIHLIGNGRGLVAMAHASGGVEIYSQDRGHKWMNHVDTWVDPQNPSYPPHLGGGFNYYVAADGVTPGAVRSTRFED